MMAYFKQQLAAEINFKKLLFCVGLYAVNIYIYIYIRAYTHIYIYVYILDR